MANITGRDGWIISEALAFAYAAMKYLPQMLQPESNMNDMRALLFAGSGDAELRLAEAMFLAWFLTHDMPPHDDGDDLLRHVREQVLQDPSPPDPFAQEREGPSDTAILVQYIDKRLDARKV